MQSTPRTDEKSALIHTTHRETAQPPQSPVMLALRTLLQKYTIRSGTGDIITTTRQDGIISKADTITPSGDGLLMLTDSLAPVPDRL